MIRSDYNMEDIGYTQLVGHVLYSFMKLADATPS